MEKETVVHYRKRNSRRSRGFGLLDVMLALTASAFMLASIASMQGNLRQSQSAITIAHQVQMVSDTVKTYMGHSQNYQALSSLIPSNGAIEIPLVGSPTWQGIGDIATGGGTLPTNFQPVLPNGQTIHLLVRHVPASGNVLDHLDALVVTSGPRMNDRQVGLAMNAMEGNGGGIMTNPPPGLAANAILGSFGSWNEPINSWQSAGVPLSGGHIAYTLSSVTTPLSDYLNRYNTGNPEANRMHTAIDSNNNNINNVSTLDTENVDNSRGDNVHFGKMLQGDYTLEQTGNNVAGAIALKHGLLACVGNDTGCGIQVSDDGGFYDLNNGWITMVASYQGGGLYVRNGSLAVDVSASIKQYLGTNGYDPANGYPSNLSPGIHSGNIYSEGIIGTGQNGSLQTSLDNQGNIYGARWLSMGQGVNVYNGSIQIQQGYIEAHNGNISADTGNIVAINGYVYAGDHISTPGYVSGKDAWFGGSGNFGNGVNINNGTNLNVTGSSYVTQGSNTYGNSYVKGNSQVDSNINANGTINAGWGLETYQGNITADNGNLLIKQGDAWINNGSLTVGKDAYVKNTITVGRDAQGNLGMNGNGGNIVLRGNMFMTGGIQFTYGNNSATGGPDGTGGVGGNTPSNGCTTGQSLGYLAKMNNTMGFCSSDGRWHQFATTDGYQ